jgi:hypothetical protein
MDLFAWNSTAINHHVHKRTDSVSETDILIISCNLAFRDNPEISVGIEHAYIDYDSNIIYEVYDDIQNTDGRFD